MQKIVSGQTNRQLRTEHSVKVSLIDLGETSHDDAYETQVPSLILRRLHIVGRKKDNDQKTMARKGGLWDWQADTKN